ncbi:MAG: hypothetical protein C4345_08815 [Chloroflexota bacterium]
MPDSDPARSIKIHFEGVGPLSRTTVGTDSVEPHDEALNDALHWIWSWQLQIRRLQESFDAEWQGGTALERRRAASRVSYDEHILTVVGWHLTRAIKHAESLFPHISLPARDSEALRLLRHLYEHWDEQRAAFRSDKAPKAQSAAKFSSQFPQGRPWTIVFEKDDWILAGVVRLNELTQAVRELESAVLKAEAERKSFR